MTNNGAANKTARTAPTTGGDAGAIKLAILAVGGQGGGVLTNWIVDLAQRNGYAVQATSVPGVAQRTGATIYYIEMLPASPQTPVFALMPMPGDVDIVVAAEIMEAGRAVTRGLVTPDRTTLIASTHRMYAVSEKVVPGDGIVASDQVSDGLTVSAKKVISHDLAAVADRHGAHISASLLGALAGSQTLPFSRDQFEATIRASGRGVEASLSAFADAFALAAGTLPSHVTPTPDTGATEPQPSGHAPHRLLEQWKRVAARIDDLPQPCREIALAGLRKVVDFQDLAYGTEYLDHLANAARLDHSHRGEAGAYRYTSAVAKHLANAMCYDDIIRVADLKTRATRLARVRDDVAATDDTIVNITEYFHPRAEEVIATMPASLGRYVERRRWLRGFIAARCRRGRRWRSDAMAPFIMLYAMGGMRRWRRSLLRHEREIAHRDRWLAAAESQLSANYDLAVEILNARRLIKGYSDTHSRGLSKFDRVLEGIELVKHRPDAAQWARRLLTAALSNVEPTEIEETIRTIQSFCDGDGEITTRTH